MLIHKDLSLTSLGHFTRSADCYEGLHLNKACLIPLPTMTSREPDTSVSSDDDDAGDDDDDANDLESTPKTPSLSPKESLT